MARPRRELVGDIGLSGVVDSRQIHFAIRSIDHRDAGAAPGEIARAARRVELDRWPPVRSGSKNTCRWWSAPRRSRHADRRRRGNRRTEHPPACPATRGRSRLGFRGMPGSLVRVARAQRHQRCQARAQRRGRFAEKFRERGPRGCAAGAAVSARSSWRNSATPIAAVGSICAAASRMISARSKFPAKSQKLGEQHAAAEIRRVVAHGRHSPPRSPAVEFAGPEQCAGGYARFRHQLRNSFMRARPARRYR